MIPEFGSIEYYELVGLKEKLQSSKYNKFELKSLDALRLQIEIALNTSREIYKINKPKNNE